MFAYEKRDWLQVTSKTGAMRSCLIQSSCFVRQGTKIGSTEKCGQIISILRRMRQDATVLSPSGVDSPSILKKPNIPRQVLKLIPSRFCKLIPCEERTSLPSLFRVISSQGLITGLSSAKSHGRPLSAKFFQSPAEPIFGIPKQSLSLESPAESIIKVLNRPLSKTSAKYLFHRAILRPFVKDLFS